MLYTSDFDAVKLGSLVALDVIATGMVYLSIKLGNPERCLALTQFIFRVFS